MDFNSSEKEEDQARDGRLTIVLLLIFLLQFFLLHHNKMVKKNIIIHKCLELGIRPDKLLYLKQEGILNHHSEPLPLTYYPFFFLPTPINSADKELLMTIKGVGPALAETIVTHRQTFGPILNIDNLQAIHGIGRKRAMSLANELVFDKPE
jgi:hypothetical protein